MDPVIEMPTPVATPTADPTPAPAATPEATPTPSADPTPVTGGDPAPAEAVVELVQPKREDYQDDESFLADGLKYKTALREKNEKAEGAQPAAPAKAPVAEPTEEEKAAEAAKAGEAKPEDDDLGTDLTLRAIGALSPKDLDAKINADPALKAALEKPENAELRDSLFRAARLSVETAGYKELFPTMQQAQQASENAATMLDLDQSFVDCAKGPEGVSGFMSKLAQMNILVDDKGQTLMMADGKTPQFHPAFNSFNKHMFTLGTAHLRSVATEKDDAELLAAIDVIEAATGVKAAEQEDLPPHIIEAQKKVEADKRAIEDQRTSAERQQVETFDKSVGEEAETKIDTLFNRLIKSAALDDWSKGKALSDMYAQLKDKLSANNYFKAQQRQLARLPVSDDTKAKRVGLIMTYVHEIAGPIARQVLQNASKPVLKAQDDKKANLEAKKQTSRSEPRGSAAAALLNQTLDAAQLKDKIEKEWAASHGGDLPTIEEYLGLVAQHKAAQRQQQK